MIMHKELAAGRWFEFSLVEQMANIGMDVSRAIRAKNMGDLERSRNALYRALELIDLTKADPKNRKRLKEPCRVRECLIDYLLYDNQYGFDDEFWEKYFYQFAYAAALQRGR